MIKIAANLPLGAELIHSIHDEVLVLCPIALAQEVKEIVSCCMIEAYKIAFGEPLKVPIVFEVGILRNWGEKK
jgi:DNA polymerase I-like protein with 3'-5' exonuclease and polymerase domains